MGHTRGMLQLLKSFDDEVYVVSVNEFMWLFLFLHIRRKNILVFLTVIH